MTVQTALSERRDSRRAESDAARKRAAIEMIAEHEPSLKRTARRYSLDGEDVEDAYQRALEIVLTKAPTTDPRELIRWTHTVVKHEALAVRQGRERLLGFSGDDAAADPMERIAAAGESPGEQAERREEIARSREALRALKPAELRALSLLAAGHSYAEIGELTGFSQTKINRVLAEGRDRFRSLLSSSEDGSRCRQLRPLLSAFCDGETGPQDSATVREHLRACGRCRATMRAYRAAPRIAIAIAPALPASRSLLERAREFIARPASRLPGLRRGGSAVNQIAVTGGARGAGMAGLAKAVALCAGAAGTAACMATGVLPAPDLTPEHAPHPTVERSATKPVTVRAGDVVQREPAPVATPKPDPKPKPPPGRDSELASPEAVEAPTEAVEYDPAPAPAPVAPPSGEAAGSSSSSSSAAGEFGP
ncbi:MAG TPA: sigma-70 family RNA polymerase sigma factor [Solirubrobacterales bacterium]|jgi:RNA polymerase sigma factor (sigma-70 family)